MPGASSPALTHTDRCTLSWAARVVSSSKASQPAIHTWARPDEVHAPAANAFGNWTPASPTPCRLHGRLHHAQKRDKSSKGIDPFPVLCKIDVQTTRKGARHPYACTSTTNVVVAKPAGQPRATRPVGPPNIIGILPSSSPVSS